MIQRLQFTCRFAPIATASLVLASSALAGDGVLISEIRIDQPSFDNDEYFELTGMPMASLDGLTYLVIGDGSLDLGSGVIENVTDLTGQSLDADGFFVAAEDTFTLGTADLTTSLNFENSDNVTHLLVMDFTGAEGDDLDTDDDGVLDVMPWSGIVDLVALIKEENPPAETEYHYGPPAVGPDGVFVPGHVYRCLPDGDWVIGIFDLADPAASDTPGEANPQCNGGKGCLEDIDMDGSVGFTDLLAVLSAWGPCPDCPEDIDGDDSVGFTDLLAVLSAWGPCPAP